MTIAGRYRLDGVRGQGSSATVYAATDLRLDRPVTVKVFDPGVAADPSLRARFRRQTAKASRLGHPNVAAILDAGFATDLGDGERPFVVTEPGGRWSLRELLDRQGRLPPRQAVKLAHQVASALSYAHRQDTMHADVKPENVLVDEGGEHAKLVDFSLSFVSAKTGVTTRETIARRAAYLAPEQVRGEPVGPTTDVYGLGVLLYEMLAGRPPFVAATPEATAERRVLEHARPVGAFDPSIPAGVEAVIARALERAPERRWPTVEQLDAELGRFDTSQLAPVDPAGAAEPTAAAPTTARPVSRRGVRWNLDLIVPIVAGALALGLALLLLGPLIRGLSESSGRSPLADGLFGRMPPVPAVVGLTVPDAEALARASGLELNVIGERLTDRTPAGVIVQQSPIAGTEPTSPQPLRVTISAGVTVPDVRGKRLAEAEAALADAGWRVARVDRGIHPGRPPDTVVFQHPPPGEVAAEPGEMLLAVAE